MHVKPKKRGVERAAMRALDAAKLAQVRGLLKAERVEGTDPAGRGGN